MTPWALFWTSSSTGTAISGALSSIMPSSIRMVRFARALAGDPVMILADEPTAALDFQAGRIIMETMRDLAHDRGRVVRIVTHDPRVLEFADSI
jgi:ABC-type lipoprotein export system ATPase subunit